MSTNDEQPDDSDPGDEVDSIDDVDVIAALRSALKPPAPEPSKTRREVQKKIREETKGRFFADGWSTASEPRGMFLITSVLMLLIVLLAWFLLSPRGLEMLR